MAKGFKHLTKADRIKIEALLKAGHSIFIKKLLLVLTNVSVCCIITSLHSTVMWRTSWNQKHQIH